MDSRIIEHYKEICGVYIFENWSKAQKYFENISLPKYIMIAGALHINKEAINCQCKDLTIFDVYSTQYPQCADRCRKCGKVIDKIKTEYILNNPL